MNLRNQPFQAIKNQTKTVELRLNDEKRKQIHVKDTIVFTNIDTLEEMAVTVLEISVYRDFYELYPHYNKIEIGYQQNEEADPEDMYDYYSKEKIDEFGVLAIRIEAGQTDPDFVEYTRLEIPN